jgi:O-antigen ligase
MPVLLSREHASISTRPKSLVSTVATLGIVAYLFGMVFPLPWDVPLLLLGLFAVLAMLLDWSTASIGSRAASPLAAPVALFVAVSVMSIALSADPWHSADLSVSLLPALLLYVMIAEFVVFSWQRRWLYSTFAAVSIGIALPLTWIASSSAVQTPAEWVTKLGGALIVAPNDVILLAVLAPFGIVLAYIKQSFFSAALSGFALVLGLVAIVLLQSRTGLATFAVSVSFVLMLTHPRLAAYVLSISLIVVGTLDASLGFPLLGKFQTLVGPRLALWWVAWEMFLDAPIFGHGPHAFGQLYERYLAMPQLPSWLPIEERYTPWPHNIYLELLAERGVIGFAAFALVFFQFIRTAWENYASATGHSRVEWAGLLGALAGLAFAGLWELTLLRLWVVLIIFAMLGMATCLFKTTRRETEGFG